MEGWTPEPWEVMEGIKFPVWIDAPGPENSICQIDRGNLPNANRIVACVNALAGVPNPEGVPGLLRVSHKLVDWLDRLESSALERAKDKRFPSLVEANEKDAKNYAATKYHIEKALRACGIETS